MARKNEHKKNVIVFVGAGVDGTPASNGATVEAFKLDVNIPCIASNQVSVAVAMSGDTGTCEAAITLVFQ